MAVASSKTRQGKEVACLLEDEKLTGGNWEGRAIVDTRLSQPIIIGCKCLWLVPVVGLRLLLRA